MNMQINITDFLSVAMTIAGVIIAIVIYCKQKRNETIVYLAKQIEMFYREEQIMLDDLCKYNQTVNRFTLQKRYRKLVETDSNKIKETSSSVKRFL